MWEQEGNLSIPPSLFGSSRQRCDVGRQGKRLTMSTGEAAAGPHIFSLRVAQNFRNLPFRWSCLGDSQTWLNWKIPLEQTLIIIHTFLWIDINFYSDCWFYLIKKMKRSTAEIGAWVLNNTNRKFEDVAEIPPFVSFALGPHLVLRACNQALLWRERNFMGCRGSSLDSPCPGQSVISSAMLFLWFPPHPPTHTYSLYLDFA